MDTFKKIEAVRELVANYLKENGAHAGLSESDCQNNHIIEIGTSILCTRWEIGYAGGGFVQAVANNDLQGAIGRADNTNVRALKFYCQLMYNAGMPYFDEEPLNPMEQFIKDIANDYQLDKTHPEYCGFLNIDPIDHVMGTTFVKKWREYVDMMARYGIKVESTPTVDEVIFVNL